MVTPRLRPLLLYLLLVTPVLGDQDEHSAETRSRRPFDVRASWRALEQEAGTNVRSGNSWKNVLQKFNLNQWIENCVYGRQFQN